MRNDPGHETFRRNVRDGEADSVHGDGTFFDDVFGKLDGQFHFETPVSAGLFQADNPRAAIDVALHKMAAEPAVCEERAFEVHAITAPESSQVCALKCFFQQIEDELIVAAPSDGQAAAIDGDALACVDFSGKTGRGDSQLRPGTIFLHRDDGADVFNQTREHILESRCRGANERTLCAIDSARPAFSRGKKWRLRFPKAVPSMSRRANSNRRKRGERRPEHTKTNKSRPASFRQGKERRT